MVSVGWRDTHDGDLFLAQAILTPLGWAVVGDGVLLDILVNCPVDMRWKSGAWERLDESRAWHKAGATKHDVARLNELMNWAVL
jgi:hypothetical protein